MDLIGSIIVYSLEIFLMFHINWFERMFGGSFNLKIFGLIFLIYTALIFLIGILKGYGMRLGFPPIGNRSLAYGLKGMMVYKPKKWERVNFFIANILNLVFFSMFVFNDLF